MMCGRHGRAITQTVDGDPGCATVGFRRGPRRGHIFIGYSQQDRDEAQLIAAFLETEGYSVWWDTSLLSGENFREAIMTELGGRGPRSRRSWRSRRSRRRP
jgi:hypothetical protein